MESTNPVRLVIPSGDPGIERLASVLRVSMTAVAAVLAVLLAIA
jgi:hypothetical protein